MTQAILDFLRNAVVEYGYWAVGLTLLAENAGIPVPGETILLLASFLAYSRQELQLPWIIVVATIAATIGDNIGFALGYYGGRRLLERYQNFFKIPHRTLAARRRAICALRGGHNLFRAICIWHEDHRRAVGRSAAHAVAKVHGVQLSRRGSVGNGDFRRGLLVWAALGTAVKDMKMFDIAIAAVVLLSAAILWWRHRRKV